MNNDWTRRTFLAASGAAALAASPARAVTADRAIAVTGGRISGVATQLPGVTAWLGIPYAAPPVGALRWRPPQPVRPWTGVKRAAAFSASPCAMPQDPKSAYFSRHVTMDEDCLTLNVWAPTRPAERPRPVMVWIYGGAYVAGTSDDAFYDGSNLAAEDTVFVSINYRVGILGFFAHPELAAESPDGVSGNYALMDQIAALRWIRDNIAAFGGDPGNVTIMGQSAGSFSVAFHLVMPQSRGLFHKGIAESGAPMGRLSSLILLSDYKEMETAGAAFGQKVGAHDLAALRAMDPFDLIRADDRTWVFHPALDGALIPEHPFQLITKRRHADVPLIVGFTADEGAPFAPLGGGTPDGLMTALAGLYGPETAAAQRVFASRDAAEAAKHGREAFGDLIFNWDSTALAVAMAKSGTAPVHFYHFAYRNSIPADAQYSEGTGREMGAYHGAEIAYALKNPGVRGWPVGPEQARLTETVSGYWLAFAKSGDPNGDRRPHWPRYAPGTQTILHIDGAANAPGGLPYRERLEILGRAMDNRVIEEA